MHTQRPDDGHPLLLSAGQLPGIVVLPVGKPHPFQKLQCFFFYLGPGALLHLHGREQDVFQNGLVGEQLIALEDHADLLPHPGDGFAFPENRLPVQQDFAALNRLQTVQAAKQGAFSAAGGADDHDHLALADVQIKIFKNHVVPEGFLQMPHA